MKKIDLNKRQEQIDECITRFTREFRARFGVTPRVEYEFNAKVLKITLKELGEAVDEALATDKNVQRILPGATIRTKSRRSELVRYKQAMCAVARDMGYTVAVISRHFQFDHATVIYSIKAHRQLMETSDIDVLVTLNRIEDELKKRFWDDGNVSADNSAGNNSEPVLSAV